MDKTNFALRRRAWGGMMRGLMVLCAVLTCALAVFLIIYVLAKGVSHLSWELLSTKPSYLEGTIGILPDIISTVCMVLTTLLVVLPVGVFYGGADYPFHQTGLSLGRCYTFGMLAAKHAMGK